MGVFIFFAMAVATWLKFHLRLYCSVLFEQFLREITAWWVCCLLLIEARSLKPLPCLVHLVRPGCLPVHHYCQTELEFHQTFNCCSSANSCLLENTVSTLFEPHSQIEPHPLKSLIKPQSKIQI